MNVVPRRLAMVPGTIPPGVWSWPGTGQSFTGLVVLHSSPVPRNVELEAEDSLLAVVI